MSRGGRGGGRGGGGAGGGGRGAGGQFATGTSFMGGFTFGEVMDQTKEMQDKQMFPPTPLPETQEPTQRELRSYRYLRDYQERLRFSAYHVAIPEKKDSSHTKYSDRFDDPVEKLPTLDSAEQKARMGMEFFPTLTYQAFYSKKARTLGGGPAKKRKKLTGGDKDKLLDGAEKSGDGAIGDEEKGSGDERDAEEDEEEQDEFDDDESHGDYDNEYFETGSMDGDDMGAGDGGGDDGGTYD